MNKNIYQGNEQDRTPAAPGRTNRNRGRVIAGVTAASVLAGSAAFGAVTMLSSGPAAAGPTGHAALLYSALTSASTPSAMPAGGKHRFRDPMRDLRRLPGIDGEFTFETKAGPHTIAFERGTIQSISNGDVVVRAIDGTTWSWMLVSNSVVREHRKKTTESALSVGERVLVGGPVVNGTHDARLIIIRPQHKTRAPGASSTSTS